MAWLIPRGGLRGGGCAAASVLDRLAGTGYLSPTDSGNAIAKPTHPTTFSPRQHLASAGVGEGRIVFFAQRQILQAISSMLRLVFSGFTVHLALTASSPFLYAQAHNWPLDGGVAPPHPCYRQSIGRPLRRDRKVAGEESPGSMDKRCRITSGGREPRESATENEPPRRVA